MMSDVLTVAWKEWKELLSWHSQGARGRGGLNILIMLVVFGVVLPLQTGAEWVTSPLILLSWAWVPLLLVSSVIAQAFAGERERHTLETLLSTRLSDSSILLGKIAAAVVYGWGLAMLSLIVGLITINIAFAKGGLLIYPVEIALGGVVLTWLVASTVAAAGTLVSLHASTVRQAQQTLSMASFVIVFGAVYGVKVLPGEWQAAVNNALMGSGLVQIVLVASIVLVVATGILIAVSLGRFQRTRLILD